MRSKLYEPCLKSTPASYSITGISQHSPNDFRSTIKCENFSFIASATYDRLFAHEPRMTAKSRQLHKIDEQLYK